MPRLRTASSLLALLFLLPAATALAEGKVEHKKGMTLSSEDGNYAMALRLYVQPRVGLELGDEPGGDGITDLGFRVRRGRVYLKGHIVDPKFKYQLQMDLTKNPSLLDWYVNYGIGHGFSVTAGQWKMPFSRQHMASSSALGLIDRSVDTETFTEKGKLGPDGVAVIGRDLGAGLLWSADDDLVNAWLAAFNGNGPNNKGNDDTDLSYVVRAQVNPFGKVGDKEGAYKKVDGFKMTVGAGAVVAPILGAGSSLTLGADFAMFTGPLTVELEGFSRSWGYPDAKTNDLGFHIQGGVLVLEDPGLEIAARYAFVDTDMSGGTPVHEVTVGPNLYIAGPDLKVQLNWIGTFDGSSPEHGVVIQTTLALK